VLCKLRAYGVGLVQAALLLFALGATGALASAPPAAAAAPAPVEVFVREGCPHCAEAERFLATLAAERPDLAISIRDVKKDPAAMERLQALATEHRAGSARVPAIFVGGQLILGYSERRWRASARRRLPPPAPLARPTRVSPAVRPRRRRRSPSRSSSSAGR
jgi:glutaredoxin